MVELRERELITVEIREELEVAVVVVLEGRRELEGPTLVCEADAMLEGPEPETTDETGVERLVLATEDEEEPAEPVLLTVE